MNIKINNKTYIQFFKKKIISLKMNQKISIFAFSLFVCVYVNLFASKKCVYQVVRLFNNW